MKRRKGKNRSRNCAHLETKMSLVAIGVRSPMFSLLLFINTHLSVACVISVCFNNVYLNLNFVTSVSDKISVFQQYNVTNLLISIWFSHCVPRLNFGWAPNQEYWRWCYKCHKCKPPNKTPFRQITLLRVKENICMNLSWLIK